MDASETMMLVRPLVRNLDPYTPGEQPRIPGLVKLNTNENPYPPSPHVLKTVKSMVDGRLRLYPNPTAEPLRAGLAKLHRCAPENIIVGNGMDELLAMAVRAFVEPRLSAAPAWYGHGKQRHGSGVRSTVQYFVPSYSLYPVLGDTHGAIRNPVLLEPDFSIPTRSQLKRGRQWDFKAALTFITTPNAPSGRAYSASQLDELCGEQKGVVVLDEAYVDFAKESALSLCLKHSNVLVGRTFSKAYSLCFQRVGYFVGHPQLIGALQKMRDSYNVNGLGQAAAVATLEDLSYYRANINKVIATRESLTAELTALGFSVHPSQTNFVFARPPGFPASEWLQLLRDRKVLVRWFDHSGIRDYLRITVGSDSEAETLIKAAKAILRLRRD
jgi:histidinol-phosphate aminotransferase